MKGLQLLLASMGIKIDPSEIETAWAQSKDALPKLASSFDEISQTQKRIEAKVDSLIAWRDGIEKSTIDERVLVVHQNNGSTN